MKEKDAKLKLSKEQKADAVAKIKNYMLEEFEVETGNLRAEQLLNFFTKSVGVYYYNKGIFDSHAFISDKLDDMFMLIED